MNWLEEPSQSSICHLFCSSGSTAAQFPCRFLQTSRTHENPTRRLILVNHTGGGKSYLSALGSPVAHWSIDLAGVVPSTHFSVLPSSCSCHHSYIIAINIITSSCVCVVIRLHRHTSASPYACVTSCLRRHTSASDRWQHSPCRSSRARRAGCCYTLCVHRSVRAQSCC